MSTIPPFHSQPVLSSIQFQHCKLSNSILHLVVPPTPLIFEWLCSITIQWLALSTNRVCCSAPHLPIENFLTLFSPQINSIPRNIIKYWQFIKIDCNDLDENHLYLCIVNKIKLRLYIFNTRYIYSIIFSSHC